MCVYILGKLLSSGTNRGRVSWSWSLQSCIVPMNNRVSCNRENKQSCIVPGDCNRVIGNWPIVAHGQSFAAQLSCSS